MSTTAPKPLPVCSVVGCSARCERVGGWAPVWDRVWNPDTEVIRDAWVERPFCAEHKPKALDDARRLRLATLRKPYPLMRDWTFATFPAGDVAGRRALSTVREWWDYDDKPNLLIYGPVGSGKTGLAWPLAVALQDESPWNEVRFRNVRQMLAEVRRSFGRDEANDPTDDLIDADYLVLDDLGAERPTDWARETLATIIESRYLANYRPTIVTSNYAPSELAQRLGHDDPVIGLRIVSRLTENATQIRLDRPDLRARSAAADATQTDLDTDTADTAAEGGER